MYKLFWSFQILDDPTGNSFIENPLAPQNDPTMQTRLYKRTTEQNRELGLNVSFVMCHHLRLRLLFCCVHFNYRIHSTQGTRVNCCGWALSCLNICCKNGPKMNDVGHFRLIPSRPAKYRYLCTWLPASLDLRRNQRFFAEKKKDGNKLCQDSRLFNRKMC